VVFDEAGDDRDDGRSLGGVAFVATDFQGESGAVDQLSDDDLRIHPTFFRDPTLRRSSSDSTRSPLGVLRPHAME
jgi:hypothetical protein